MNRSPWDVAVASVLGLASSMILRVYLDRAYLESPTFDALKSLLFWGDPGEPVMHAPPLIDLAQDHMLIGWAALTGIVAAASLVWAGRMADTARSQPRAVAVVLPLLTLYCLWHSLPPLAQLTHSLRK